MLCGCCVITGGAGGASVMVAVPNAVASFTLVAVTVTVCCVVMVAGDVYSPVAEMEPVLGFKLQITDVSTAPVTVALNCCDSETDNVAVGGLTFTVTGPAYLKSTGPNICPGSAIAE